MDVDRDNFAVVFPTFLELLATSKFVAFDEEMTGIFGQGEGSQKRDDTVEERYKKMVTVATKYGIIQFGVCLFHESADGTALVATPYNFYVFPNSRDDLVVSPSAIDFLRKNKMNFDQWLSKGITYVAAEGEQWAKKKFFPDTSSSTETTSSTDEIPKQKELIKLTRQSDIDFTERNMALVEAMLASNDCNAEGTGAGDCVALESTNAFLRRVLYEQLEARYAGRVNVVKNDQNVLSALKVDPAKQADFERAQRLEKERQYNETLGFRRVFNALVGCKKPLVGHNLFFDLLFMMRWLDGPLSEDFETFRVRLNEMFPMIYDTKLIAEHNIDNVGNIDTGLERCYQHFVTERPFGATHTTSTAAAMEGVTGTEGENVTVPVLLRTSGVEIRMSPMITGFNPQAAQFHNAGYDAYATGCVFARQVEILQAQQGIEVLPASMLTFATGAHTVHCNVINMNRSFYYVHLHPASRSASSALKGVTLKVTGFEAKSVKNSDINNVFTAAGLEQSSCEIMWVDGESFLVNFPKHFLVGSDAIKTEDDKTVHSFQLLNSTGTMPTLTWPAGWTVAVWVPQWIQDQQKAVEEEAEGGGDSDDGDGDDEGDDEMPSKRVRLDMDECCTR
eukprot:gene11419-13274_t